MQPLYVKKAQRSGGMALNLFGGFRVQGWGLLGRGGLGV